MHVHPTTLQIYGTRQVAAPPRLRRSQQMEIVSGRFLVEVPLVTPVDPDRAEASYASGLLDVWLPFAERRSHRVVVLQLGEGGTR